MLENFARASTKWMNRVAGVKKKGRPKVSDRAEKTNRIRGKKRKKYLVKYPIGGGYGGKQGQIDANLPVKNG